MKYVLGVDIGTGSVKAVAVDLQGRSFEVCQHYYNFDVPQVGYHEQDPDEVWQAFIKVTKEVVAKIGAQPRGIGLSSAMHSLMPVDKTCSALTPMITWADSRSADIAKRLRASEQGIAIYKATGTPIHAMSPLCKLIWIRENNSELFRNAYKFISIKEYIWYRLFNEFKVDESIASCTGLYNIHQYAWHNEALELAGISDQQLSDPVPTNYIKYYEGKLFDFLHPGVPVIIGASDGCLANLGSMANKSGTAVMTIGTSGAVRIASNQPLTDEKTMTFSYILDRSTFICGGPINNGGIALQWWLKNYVVSGLDEEDYEYALAQTADVPAGSNGLIFLPYLTGERAPIWDSESCGVFFGIRLFHDNAHFSKAILEGICYAMNDVLSAMSIHDVSIEQINVSGGFIKSKLWLQMLADITGKKLVIVHTEDASAIGATFMVMKALGIIDDYPVSGSQDLQIIHPNESNSSFYSKRFTIFKRLYLDLKETMHDFYQMNN